MNKKLGFLFTAISGTCFGFLPIFAKLAYNNGGNTSTVLSIRFTVAALIMWTISFVLKIDYKVGKTKIIHLILLGSIGYNSTTAAYFYALNFISTPLVALVFYTNPIIVSVLSYFIIKEKVTKGKMTALTLSSMGLIMIVGFSIGNVNIVGIAYAALAAFTYSIYVIVGSRIIRGINPIIVTTYVTTGCSLMANLTGMISGGLIRIPYTAWLYSIMTAVFATVVAIITFYEGMKRIGPSQTAIISTIEPVVSTIMAAVIFNDILSFPQIVGGILIIVGIVVLQRPEEEVSEELGELTVEQIEVD